VDRTSNLPPSLNSSRGLEQRLSIATAKLKALTPPAGRGKQIRELEVLQHKAQTILKSHRVEGLVYTYEHYPATKTVGERYQNGSDTQHCCYRTGQTNLGWRVTFNALEQLSFQDAVLTTVTSGF